MRLLVKMHQLLEVEVEQVEVVLLSQLRPSRRVMPLQRVLVWLPQKYLLDWMH
jgi:hypothetical protein